MMIGRLVTHIRARTDGAFDAALVYGHSDATAATTRTTSHHWRRTRRGRTLLLATATVVVNVRRIQQRHVRRVTHAETIVAAATARRTVHRCPPHALDGLRPVIRTRRAHTRNGRPRDAKNGTRKAKNRVP